MKGAVVHRVETEGMKRAWLGRLLFWRGERKKKATPGSLREKGRFLHS